MNLTNLLRNTVFVGGAVLLLAASASAAEYKTVTKNKVNVRTGPSTKDPVYMEVFPGYPLKVLSSNGEWVKVADYENDSGWVHSTLLSKCDTAIVNAKNTVNMRAEASTGAEVVATMERGVVLTKVSKKGDWTKVRHSGGTVGWVYNKLLWP
ncbi:MAG: peptide-binding protein [Deltaproteobacteria bacterium]|nr:MAG: peptide-binding protein [Deltaproteobacteria bacterium]